MGFMQEGIEKMCDLLFSANGLIRGICVMMLSMFMIVKVQFGASYSHCTRVHLVSSSPCYRVSSSPPYCITYSLSF